MDAVSQRLDAYGKWPESAQKIAAQQIKKGTEKSLGFGAKIAHKRGNLEDKAYNQQFRRIKREHGEHAATNANYGWSVEGGKEHTHIATKVYGQGVLHSHIDHKAGTISHEWD